MEDITEKEMKKIEKATIYELRLLIDAKDQKEYTKEEIIALLDEIARVKEQE